MDFFEELAMKAGMGAVRGWFRGYLKNITPQQLNEGIANNQDLWSVAPNKMMQEAKRWKHLFGKYFMNCYDKITTDLMLEWMQKDYPQLGDAIMFYPGGVGYHWFDGQVEKIKQQIKEM